MKKRILSLLLAIITVAALALPNAGSVMAASYKTYKYEGYDWTVGENVTRSCTWKYESKEKTLYFSKGFVPSAYSASGMNYPWAKYLAQVKKISIGKGVAEFSDIASYYAEDICPALTDFVVSADNPYFTAKDGILYNKKMTEILAIPASWGRKTYTVPKGIDPNSGSNGMYLIQLRQRVQAFKVEKGSKYLAAKDGVLYDKEMSCILLYPAKKTDTTYTVPKTVAVSEFDPMGGEGYWGEDFMNFPVCIKEFKVEKGNPYHTAKDGVLYNKDMTQLIRYPSGKKSLVYRAPSSLKKNVWGMENLLYYMISSYPIYTRFIVMDGAEYEWGEETISLHGNSGGSCIILDTNKIKNRTPSKVSSLKIVADATYGYGEEGLKLTWKVDKWSAADGFVFYQYNTKTKKYEEICTAHIGEFYNQDKAEYYLSTQLPNIAKSKAKYAVAALTVQKDGSVKYGAKTTFTFDPKK